MHLSLCMFTAVHLSSSCLIIQEWKLINWMRFNVTFWLNFFNLLSLRLNLLPSTEFVFQLWRRKLNHGNPSLPLSKHRASEVTTNWVTALQEVLHALKCLSAHMWHTGNRKIPVTTLEIESLFLTEINRQVSPKGLLVASLQLLTISHLMRELRDIYYPLLVSLPPACFNCL